MLYLVKSFSWTYCYLVIQAFPHSVLTRALHYPATKITNCVPVSSTIMCRLPRRVHKLHVLSIPMSRVYARGYKRYTAVFMIPTVAGYLLVPCFRLCIQHTNNFFFRGQHTKNWSEVDRVRLRIVVLLCKPYLIGIELVCHHYIYVIGHSFEGWASSPKTYVLQMTIPILDQQ